MAKNDAGRAGSGISSGTVAVVAGLAGWLPGDLGTSKT